MSKNIQSGHLYFGTSLLNWIKLLVINRGANIRKIFTLIKITLIIIILIPVRLFALLIYGRKISKTKIQEKPLFIIGHWRSGTSHLQNLISLDDQFGTLIPLEGVFPHFGFILRRKNRKKGSKLDNFQKKIKFRRPQDNISFSLGSGNMDEEFVTANTSTLSTLHGLIFVKHLRLYFEKYMLYKDASIKVLKKWKKQYFKSLQRISFATDEKRLLLKSSYNTTRIRLLRELFPDAKFIYIYRNPYKVILSTIHTMNKIDYMNLKKSNEKQILDDIFAIYKQVIKKADADMETLPPKDLIKIRYEDFTKNTPGMLKEIYETLELGDWDVMEKKVNEYMNRDSIKNYKKNNYNVKEELINRIAEECKEELSRWNYSCPSDIIIEK